MAIWNYGIDVSSNNGAINWDQVKADPQGIAWAYIKITEGATYKDSQAAYNASQAVRVGIPFGVYHFAHLTSTDVETSAIQQADAFMAALNGQPGATLIPVLDIEVNEENLTSDQVVLFIQTFVQELADNGFACMIYSDLNWFNTNLPADNPLASLPLWIAEYNSFLTPTLPKGWSSYTMWQYTAAGRVQGITGNVDMSKSPPDLVAAAKVAGLGTLVVAAAGGLFF